jgi:hypothetical protein
MLIRKVISAATVAGTYFPLQGSQYEYLPFNAYVEFAILQTGGTDANLATVFSGSDVLQEQSPIDVKATAPTYPDDFLLADAAAAGERLGIQVTKVDTNDAINVAVRITPL